MYDVTIFLHNLNESQVAIVRSAVLGVMHPTADVSWKVDKKEESDAAKS